MPGTAKSSTSTTTAPTGKVPVTSWTFTDARNRVFEVTMVSFLAGTMAKGPQKTVLDTAVANVASALGNRTVASQSDITLDGCPGRSFLMTSPKMNVRGEVLLAGDTVYTIGMGYAPSEADDGSAAAFLASFKLGV